MKKGKIFTTVLFGLLSMVMLFSLSLIRTNNIQNEDDGAGALAAVSASDVLHVTYKVFDADLYKWAGWSTGVDSDYVNTNLDSGGYGPYDMYLFLASDNPAYDTNFSASELETAWKAGFSGRNAPTWANIYGPDGNTSAYDYYSALFGIDATVDNLLALTSYPTEFPVNAEVSEVKSGDNIMIEIWASCTSQIYGAQVAIEVSGFSDFNSLQAFTNAGTSGNATEFTTPVTMFSPTPTGGKIVAVGGSADSPISISTPVKFGTICCPVTATGDFTITVYKNSNDPQSGNSAHTTASSTTYDALATPDAYSDTPLTISLGGAKTSTGITPPVVNTVPSTLGEDSLGNASNSVIIGANTYTGPYDAYTPGSGAISSTSTSVTVPITGADGSTILGVASGEDLDEALSNLASGATLSGSAGNYNVSLGDPGDTTYVAVLVQSQSGNETDIVIIPLERPQSNNNLLNGINVSNPTVGASNVNTLTLSPSFSSSTTGYDVEMADDLQSFRLNLTKGDSTQTITVKDSKGNTLSPITTGGTSYNINMGTGSNRISGLTITVEAQNGADKEYTISFDEKSTEIDRDDFSLIFIDNTNAQHNTSSANTASTWDYGTLSYKSSTGTLITGVTTAPTLKPGSTISEVRFVDGTTNVNILTSTATISFSGVLKCDKSATIRLIAEAGNYEDITVTISRAAADTDNTIEEDPVSGNPLLFVYNQDNEDITQYGSWSSDGKTFTIDSTQYKIPYAPTSGAAGGIYVKAKFASTATATISGGNSASTSYTSDSLAGAFTFTTSSPTSLTVTLTITSESNAPEAYFIKVTKATASTDNTISTAETDFFVYDNEGSDITNDGSWSDDGSTFTLATALPYDPSASGIKVKVSFNEFATATIKSNVVTTAAVLANETVSSLFKFGSTYDLTVTIKVTSQSGSPKEYFIKAKMEAPANDYNVDLVLTYTDALGAQQTIDFEQTFTTDSSGNVTGGAYNNTNDKLPYSLNGSTVKFKFTVTDPTNTTTDIKISGATSSCLGIDHSRNLSSSLTFNYVIMTQADQVGKSFVVTVSIADPNDDHGAGFERVEVDYYPNYATAPNNKTTYTLVLEQASNTYKNDTPIPYPVGTEKVEYRIYTSVETNKIFVGSENVTSTDTSPLTKLWTGFSGTNLTKDFVVKTQANTTGHNYKIEIVTEAPDTDTSLSPLANAVVVQGSPNLETYSKDTSDPSASDEIFVYNIDQDVATGGFVVSSFTPNSPYAKVYVSTSSNTLGSLYDPTAVYSVGTTLFFTVQAQSPQDSLKYTIITKAMDKREKNNAITEISSSTVGLENVKGNFDSKFALNSTDPTTNTVSITVPYSVKEVVFDKITLAGTYATYAPGSAQPNVTYQLSNTGVGNPNVFKFQAKAQNDTLGTVYTLEVTRETAETDNYLESLVINGVPISFDKTNNTIPIHYCLPSLYRTVSTVNVSYTLSDKAFVDISNLTHSLNYTQDDGDFTTTVSINGNVTTLTFKVKSEQAYVNGSSTARTYTVYLYTADQTFNINDIDILAAVGGAELKDISNNVFRFDATATGTQVFEVPYSVDKATFDVILASDSSRAVILDKSNPYTETLNADSSNLVTIQVVSEFDRLRKAIEPSYAYTQTKTYVIDVQRGAASTEDRLSALEVSMGGTVQSLDKAFDKDVNAYYIENIGNTSTTATVKFTKMDPNSSVTVSGPNVSAVTYNTNTEGTFTATISLSSVTSLVAINISVKSESAVAANGAANTYQVSLCLGSYNKSNNNNIQSIKVYADNNSTTDLMNPSFAQGTINYANSIRASVSSLKVDVVLEEPSKAIYTINGGSNNIISVDPSGVTVIKVQCTAEDQSKGTEYVITLTTLVPDQDNTLKTFTINGNDVMSFVNSDSIYYVENSVTRLDVAASANSQYATIAPFKNVYNPFNISKTPTAVSITVTSEAGVPETYTVLVMKKEVNTLDNLEVYNGSSLLAYKDGKTFSSNDVGPYYVEVPYSVTEIRIDYLTTGDPQYLTVTGAGVQTGLQVGNNPFKVKVQDASLSATSYDVIVIRDAGSSACDILTYTQEDGVEYNQLNTGSINYQLDRDFANTLFNPTITVSDGASYTISPTARNLSVGRNTFSITVTSQNNSTKVYPVTVIVADLPESNTNTGVLELIDNIEVHSDKNSTELVDLDNETYDYDATITNGYPVLDVPYKTNVAYLYVKLASTTSKLFLKAQGSSTFVEVSTLTAGVYKIELELDTVGSYKYEVYSESEYASFIKGQVGYEDACSSKYTIEISRKAANSDASLSVLTVVDSTGKNWEFTPKFDPANVPNASYVIENIGNITNITITAIPKYDTTNVEGDFGNITLDALDITNAVNYLFVKKIKTTAEDDFSTCEYTITISRGPVELDAQNEFASIDIYDSADSTNIFFDGDKDGFTFTNEGPYGIIEVLYGSKAITFAVDKGTSIAPMTFTGTADGQTMSFVGQVATVTILDAWYDEVPRLFKVKSTSQDGSKVTEFSFNIKFVAPNENNKLADLKYDGVSVPGFDPESEGPYTIPTVPNNVNKINIQAILGDTSQTIVSGDGDWVLTEGFNSRTVVISSESGQLMQYVLNVTRDTPNPYLVDISVEDGQLLDESDTLTTFDKDTTVYHVIVPYTTVSTNITVQVPNSNYITSCTNSNSYASGDIRTFSELNLAVGANSYVITATSPDGKKVNYTLLITRRGESSADTSVGDIIVDAFDIKGTEIQDHEVTLGSDYNHNQNVYSYVVPNRVTDLLFDVTPNILPDKTNGTAGAKVEVFNANDLRVGDNTIVVLITAEDGVNTKTLIINVERLPMSYNIDKDAYEDYVITDDEDGNYVIDLGDKRADVIEDYTKYIEVDPADNLTVTVLSDIEDPNCSEVIIAISDGDEVQTVRLKLQSTAIGTGVDVTLTQAIPWILLAIGIVLLIVILICVNRDKYGSINSKRKKQEN